MARACLRAALLIHMRVSNNMLTGTMITQLNRLGSRQVELQNQASTGQKLLAPEDDPAATRRVLTLQAEAKALSQYQSNVNTLKDTATASLGAIKGLKTVSDRASEVATLVSGTTSQENMTVYATEIKELIEQAVSSANSTQNGEYLFGGTDNGQAPFSVTRDANGWITGVTYQGNTTVTEAEIDSKQLVSATVPGANTSGTGTRGLITDSRTGADFFNHLIELQNHLRDGNASQITDTDRANLAKDEDNLIYHISANGVTQARLEAKITSYKDRAEALDDSISNNTDSDLVTTLVQLSRTKTAYQAAMQSGSMLLDTSLLDYIS